MVLGHHLSFPHIRVLYPTAPLRPYTLADGSFEHVWFDRPLLKEDAPEHLATIEPTAREINQLIDQEVKLGIDIKRIVIGGFSMGGSMALQMAYRFRPDIGGVFVLSSFLNKESKVYETLSGCPDTPRPPLFMCHGQKDDLVPHSWGHNTFQELQKHHIQGSFHSLPNVSHTISREELTMLKNWIVRQVP
ncbi:hypothetical protein Pcinc_014200 [Petrolisthes cinctipes]|uniref:palmitoyl-protein hydrolase n=1 Tax=Petrolisthes cinctipes TaxID=88211 RepID=A0AAE1FVU3_PETCI|nr:hypothetical protein Pcinc_014200 [Petrolisthes cinctipes]